jgi:phosphoglycolate phosphatase
MKLKHKSLLMFDLDGTLVDSAPDIAIAANAMLTELGRESFPASSFRHWIGNGATVMVQRALSGSSDIDPDLDPDLFTLGLKRFLSLYLQDPCIESQLYPGVAQTLAQLKTQQYHIAVVTNKPNAFIQPILNQLKIKDCIDFVIGGDDLDNKKPHPQQLQHTCQHFGVSPAQAVMIGDSKNDILAAKAANISSIGLSYGYNYGEDINLHQPDFSCDHFAEIMTVLSC